MSAPQMLRTPRGQPITILVAEDDPADWQMIEEGFEDASIANPVKHVRDGVDLLAYLRDEAHEKPGLILLDLNMPRLNGFETLAEIRADPALRHLVVVIMTTSNAEADILRSYNSGANSYIVKPLTFLDMIKALRTLESYWVELVSLPVV